MAYLYFVFVAPLIIIVGAIDFILTHTLGRLDKHE
jgi:hypothetical protein